MKRVFRRLILFMFFCGFLVAGFSSAQKEVLKAAYPIAHETAILTYAEEYGVDPALVYALIRTESSWRETAKSHAGAQGLMQITEPTFDFILMRTGWTSYTYDDMFQPTVNIRCGIYFLSFLLNDFDGETDTALAAYNAGRGRVQGWLGDARFSLDGETLDYIPYRETREYVKKVNTAYAMYTQLYFSN